MLRPWPGSLTQGRAGEGMGREGGLPTLSASDGDSRVEALITIPLSSDDQSPNLTFPSIISPVHVVCEVE